MGEELSNVCGHCTICSFRNKPRLPRLQEEFTRTWRKVLLWLKRWLTRTSRRPGLRLLARYGVKSLFLVRFQARPIFLTRIDDSHCDRIHFYLTAVRCFDNGYVGKQPVAWKEYCVEYWLKELQESMDTLAAAIQLKYC